MRVGIASLWHESNTFLGRPTTLADFQHDLLLAGEEVRERLAGGHHEIGGFFAGLEAEGMEAVPLLVARALPSGVIEERTWRRLLEAMLSALGKAGPLDALLVAPHGAAVGENEPDLDGYWLGELRSALGPERPIIGTLDPHANLSPRMAAATDALLAYRTNPHLDQRETGLRGARLLARALRGEVRPVQHAAFPPLAINIERQFTAEPPCSDLFALADLQLQEPGILANSVLLGFPYADVPEMGSSLLAVADGEPDRAATAAEFLAAQLWSRREAFRGELLSIDDALRRARHSPAPVCLLDMGDNIGGGSPGDGTWLLAELLEKQLGPAFVCLCDPAAVEGARRRGVGSRGEYRLGGSDPERQGPAVQGEFEVVRLHEGKFRESQVRHGGFAEFDQGPTALLHARGGMTVMVTSRPMPPFSLQQLRSCGLDPTAFRLLVAKGVHAPVAAYREVCPTLLRVNTPGITSADLTSFDYQFRRRPMFPWEDDG